MSPSPGLSLPYTDRRQAGRGLAGLLAHYRGQAGLLVLGLPRGGVVLGFEVARALEAPLDVLVVRKLGFPGHEEYAMGALASGGIRVMNPLPGSPGFPVSSPPAGQNGPAPPGVERQAVAEVVAREQAELARREQLYRSRRPAIALRGRVVLLVDDGLATGATLRAAVLAARQQRPARLVVAVPVGAAQACESLRPSVDEFICAATPDTFEAVSQYYLSFEQTGDEEVQHLLAQARREHGRTLL